MLSLRTSNQLPESVSHPATGQSYLIDNTAQLTVDEYINVYKRYGEKESPYICDALETATSYAVAHSQSIEFENTNRVLMATHDPIGNSIEYADVVANIDRIPEFMKFFRRISHDIFSQCADSSIKDPKLCTKVALGLLITFQKGDWESTSALDTVFRNLKTTFENDPEANYQEFEKPEERMVTYRYTPLPDLMHEEGLHSTDFGIINRRRRVANVHGIGLFKQSKGLVVTSYLPDDVKEQVKSSPYGQLGPKIVADIIGTQFEADISSEKGSSKAILPISAHYLMIAINPHNQTR